MIDVERKVVRRVRGAESAEGEQPIERAVVEFWLSFAENALQLVSSGARREVEHVN